jgi:molybdopterin molybdotransferase
VYDIGLAEAWELARKAIGPLGLETVAATELVGRVCGRDVIARIDYPSADSSTKDGYAVVSGDVGHACAGSPVDLRVVGMLGAGDPCAVTVEPGTAVRVLSGALVPPGADAVLAEEFAEKQSGFIRAVACAEPGRNILAKGAEIGQGEILIREGQVFSPAGVSLVVAGGNAEAAVFRRPVVGLLATGNEVLLPGRLPETGKLFASNLALQDAWLRSRGMRTIVQGAGDSCDDLAAAVESLLAECDVLITSGGAWKGDRDLIVSVLETLGWEQSFHRVRLGPGKAVAMGRLNNKPVFCLPGGPPSNEVAFLLIAFPSVLRMAGHTGSPYPCRSGVLERDVGGQQDWTQVIHCRAVRDSISTRLIPLQSRQRLRSMARADGLVVVPEGVAYIAAGSTVPYLCLTNGFVEDCA